MYLRENHHSLAALIGLALLLISSLVAIAQDGALDLTFGTGGTAITPVRAGYDSGYGVAIQADGKIVVVGESQRGNDEFDYDMALVRYNEDGSLDQGFGNGGKVITSLGSGSGLCGSVAIQPDGKIVVAGQTLNGSTFDFIIARYQTNGSPDNSFSNNGRIKVPVGSSHDYGWFCSLQPNGKIIAAGPVRQGPDLEFGMVRLNTNGSLDNSFGNGGKVITPFSNADDFSWSCALAPDGKIVVGGASTIGDNRKFAVARYLTNGTLDPSFSADGKVVTSIGAGEDKGRSVIVQPDGKIILGGYSRLDGHDQFVLVRYKLDGSLDPEFDGDGIVHTLIGTGGNVLWQLALQNDGKVLAAGYASNGVAGADFALARYHPNGMLDNTFGDSGIVLAPVGMGSDFGIALALQGESRIVMAGTSVSSTYDFAVAAFQNGLVSNISAPSPSKPAGYFLSAAVPNPFSSSTQVKFQIPQAEWVTLKVYDYLGREIITLLDEMLSAGNYEQVFAPDALEAGIYFFRLRAGSVILTERVLHIK